MGFTFCFSTFFSRGSQLWEREMKWNEKCERKVWENMLICTFLFFVVHNSQKKIQIEFQIISKTFKTMVTAKKLVFHWLFFTTIANVTITLLNIDVKQLRGTG